ncbi:MAG: hypothetical protein ACTHLO_02975 [Pseudolabrys sp.]
MIALARIPRSVGRVIAALSIAMTVAALMPAAAMAASRYVVEFRARDGGVFGHTYVAYGLTDRSGRLRYPHYAGFYPSGALSRTALLAVLVTPAKVGSEPWDRTKRTEIVYRRELSPRAYARLVRDVDDLSRIRPFWHLILYNCNSFAADVARWMGLQVPSTLQVPKDFVQQLYLLNRRDGMGVAYAAAGAGGRVVPAPDMFFMRVMGGEPVDR